MRSINRSSLLCLAIGLIVCSCKGSYQQKNPLKPEEKISSSSPQMISQTISINIEEDPTTLDPRKMLALSDINLSKMLFEGLTRIGKDGKATLALAKKIDVSSDFTTYTITLRPSYWSDQTPLTAHDFIYSWKKTLSPSFSAPNANMLYVIKNAAKIKDGELPSSLLGAEAIDDETLRIHLSSPIPYFLDLISHPVFLPVPAKVDRINPNWAHTCETFVSNGPFALQKWAHCDVIELTKNLTYWDASSVQIDKLQLMMVSAKTGMELFKAEKLHWNGSPFSTIPPDARKTLKERGHLNHVDNLGTHWIRVNTALAPLDTKKMRQALGFAINRKALIDHIMQGNQRVTTGIVPATMKISSGPYFKDGDLAKALDLFQAVLKEKNLTHETFPALKLLYPSNHEERHRLAQALQDQWQKAFGIPIELDPTETQVYFRRIANGDYDLAIGSWYADFNDPINFLEVFKSKNVATNNTNWEDSKYKKLLEESYFCHKKEERNEILFKSEKIIIDAMPVIPLYTSTMLYTKDRQLRDVVLTPMGIIDFKWAYLSPDQNPDQSSDQNGNQRANS